MVSRARAGMSHDSAGELFQFRREHGGCHRVHMRGFIKQVCQEFAEGLRRGWGGEHHWVRRSCRVQARSGGDGGRVGGAQGWDKPAEKGTPSGDGGTWK